MPSRTLTPAPLATAGQDTVPEPPSPSGAASDARGPAAAEVPGPTAAETRGPAAAEVPGPTAAETRGPAAAEVPGPTAAEVPAGWSGLRLIEVPAGWPPYDCETHGAACQAARSACQANSCVSGQAADVAEPSAGPSLPPKLPGPAGPGPRSAQSPAASRNPAFGAAIGPGVPAARADTAVRGGAVDHGAAWPVRFAQVMIEVLAGSRSPRQLVPWTTEPVRAQIDLLTQTLPSEQRPRIRRIMPSRPAAEVVEMTVVVSFGPRSRALAMRFEHLPARQPALGRPGRPAHWLCTEFEAG